MSIYLAFIFLLCINKIFSFLIVALKIIKADDCIKSITLDNDYIYFRSNDNCDCGDPNNIENIEEKTIPYEIGQILNVTLYDIGGACSLQADVIVNYCDISSYEKEFWTCEKCEVDKYFESKNNEILCYEFDKHPLHLNPDRNITIFNFLLRIIFITQNYFHFFSLKNLVYLLSYNYSKELYI